MDRVSKQMDFKKIPDVFRKYQVDLDNKLYAGIFLNFEVLLKRICLIDCLEKKRLGGSN